RQRRHRPSYRGGSRCRPVRLFCTRSYRGRGRECRWLSKASCTRLKGLLRAPRNVPRGRWVEKRSKRQVCWLSEGCEAEIAVLCRQSRAGGRDRTRSRPKRALTGVSSPFWSGTARLAKIGRAH